MDIQINVTERDSNNFQAITDGRRLVEIVMNINPESAIDIAEFMVKQAMPIIKWRNHPLKQWAMKKTEASHRSGL